MTNQQFNDYTEQPFQQEAPVAEQQITNHQRMKRWKKVLLFVCASLIICIITIPSLPKILNIITKDIPPINEDDLQLRQVTIPDSDNAYFDLEKIDDVIYFPSDHAQIIRDMIAGKTWDNAVAEDIISKNSEALLYFSEAASKPLFQDPILGDPGNYSFDAPTPALSVWRQAAQISAVRALYLTKQGKDKEAMNEVLRSVQIGQKIQESQSSLIEFLVALAMKELGLETLQSVLATSKLSSIEIKQYIPLLDQFYKNEGGLISAFIVEYLGETLWIKEITSGNQEFINEINDAIDTNKYITIENTGEFTSNYYFRPNESKLIIAENIRKHIQSATAPCGEIVPIDIQPLAPTNLVLLILEENAIGKILHDMSAASLTNVSIRKCEEDLLVAATQALLAIKAFKNDTNAYPTSLSELVPTYLSALPQDPFDGKPLKYSSEKNILYSVGKNMEDNGGSTGDDWRKMPDPTFTISF